MADREFSAEIKALGDQIAGLKVSQAVELGDYLETAHGIKAAAVAGPVGGGGGGGNNTPPPPVEVKDEFTVILEGFDAAKKINVIKVVREITGLGLKEAKDLVEGAPKPVKENLPKAEAEKLKKQLEDGGAKVALK